MKISIITAAYNSGKTLADTMSSVLSQTYGDWEHIIVDGASKDNTVELIHEFEPRYGGRLKWVSEPDKGLYDAMNKGIAMASGEVVSILNSDDFFSSPGVLARIAEAMADESIDAVYGDIHYVNPADTGKCVRYYSGKWFRRWTMMFGYMPPHPSFYCRKSIYDRHGNFDTRFSFSADFDILVRLIYLNRIRTKYLPMDFVTMRTGGISTSGLTSHRNVMNDHFKVYSTHGLPLGYIFDPLRFPLKIGEIMLDKMNLIKHND